MNRAGKGAVRFCSATGFAALTLMLLVSSASAMEVQGCVTPKSSRLPNGNLELRFIEVFNKPGGRPIYVRVAAPLSLYVIGEQRGWLRLGGSPSSPFKDGLAVGWVRRSDVQDQALRNCNLALEPEPDVSEKGRQTK